MNGGKGLYVGGTLDSILISLWRCTSRVGASRRSSSASGPRTIMTLGQTLSEDD